MTTTLTAAQLNELDTFLTQYGKSRNLDPEEITGQGTSDGVAYIRVSVLRELLALGRASLQETTPPRRSAPTPFEVNDRVKILGQSVGGFAPDAVGLTGTISRVFASPNDGDHAYHVRLDDYGTRWSYEHHNLEKLP